MNKLVTEVVEAYLREGVDQEWVEDNFRETASLSDLEFDSFLDDVDEQLRELVNSL